MFVLTTQKTTFPTPYAMTPNTATIPSLHASPQSCAAARALGLRRFALRGSQRTNVWVVRFILSFCVRKRWHSLCAAHS